jgi:large subunit ribosomal protein L13
MKMTKTTKQFNSSTADQKWVLIDAENKPLGRLATRVTDILRGKNKAQFTPNNDCGDFVVVINAEKVKLTGGKVDKKMYFRNPGGYMGALKTTSAREMLEKKPEQVIFNAVKSMLPKNKLSNQLITKLKVYSGEQHPHHAQKPITEEIK